MTLNETKCIKSNYSEGREGGGVGDRAEKIMDHIITMYEDLQALITDDSKLNMTLSGKGFQKGGLHAGGVKAN